MARLHALPGGESASPELAELRSVVIHGHRRAYREAGPPDAPALVLLHGIGDDSATWEPVVAALARYHRVITPDLLGHGGSAKPRADYSIGGFANGVGDLLTVLGVERASVVGHSLGGGVAMQFAYQHPERCERLVLVATGGVSRRLHPGLRALTLPGTAWTLTALRATRIRWLAERAADALTHLDVATGLDARDLLRVLERLPDVEARSAFVRTLRSVVDVRGQVVTMLDRAYLAAHLPTLLVWGERDVVVPVRDAHIAHAAIADSWLEILPDAGHFPHRSDPDRFVTAVTRFLRGTSPAQFDERRWQQVLLDGPSPGCHISVAHLDGAG